MRRLFYKGELAKEIEITGTDAHHLMHVLRARAGDEMVVVDDRNRVARMEMVGFTREAVTMRLKERLEMDTESPADITLAQCLLKADKMDFVVQKAVELGARRVVPIMSRNCVVRYDAKKREERRNRWQKIADEAAKQCGRTVLLEVAPVVELSSFLESVREEEGLLLFCYENERKQSVRECLKRADAGRCLMLIGPEGGFAPEEAESAKRCGGISVTLGPRILRAETAAVAALAIVQYEKGDLG
ncbi:MAG: 16S rRNA (uracil(1498)-N(3))-methyltransferase [Selenomonadaceae bacterium]|nr:16S rRNA (uracil(1498)-N(3))-methyltransferase [Selenomonadaceae bacterium]